MKHVRVPACAPFRNFCNKIPVGPRRPTTQGVAVKLFALSAGLLLAASPSWAAQSCDELKARIEAKLQGKNVKGYTLAVLPKDEQSAGKVVATCAAGKSKIVYTRK